MPNMCHQFLCSINMKFNSWHFVSVYNSETNRWAASLLTKRPIMQ